MDVVKVNGYLKTWGKDHISFADICRLAKADSKCTIVQMIVSQEGFRDWSDYMNYFHMIDFEALKKEGVESFEFKTFPIHI